MNATIGRGYEYCVHRLNLFETTTAALSLWFAFILSYYRGGVGPRPEWAFSTIAAIAALLKIVGMVRQSHRLRLAGLALGSLFWVVLAVVLFLTVSHSITWGGYVILAIAQGCRVIAIQHGD